MSDTPSKPTQNRECGEPEELHNPISKPILVFFALVIAWGVSFYFRDISRQPEVASRAGDQRSPVRVDPAAAVNGEAVYAGNCAACHQATGQGLAGVFPPLAGSEWVLTDTPAALIQILLHGLNGPIEVAGGAYNGVMPAFANLSDAEIAAVLSHIRGRWGNTATPIAATAVAEQRQAAQARSGAWTAEELKTTFGEWK